MYYSPIQALRDEERIAALRASALNTADPVLAERFTRLADGFEKRRLEAAPHDRKNGGSVWS